MAKIRKLNVSEITGTSPYTGDTDAVMPLGTVVVYEKDTNGVIEHVLRVHDGVSNGGIALGAGEGPVIFNGSDGIVRNNLDEGIAALFNNGDVYITGGESLRFTGLSQFEGGSTAMLRFWDNEGRHSTTTDATELVTLNVGNDAAEGDPTEGFFKIVTEKEVGGEKEWKFDANGVLHLPTNGDILDSDGNSVLGSSSTPNVWVQTFASEDGYPADLVSMASSVEYDIAGNVIALFTHNTGFVDNQPVSSYYSVAKFTTAGLKLWQVRLSSTSTITYTDGWGLAVDNIDNRIYVAGRVEVEGFYNQSSLVKLNSEDGSLIWSNIYDFGAQSDSPVVDVDREGNPIVVGYYSTEEDTNDGVTVTKIDRLDGSIIWSRLLDGQNDDEAYGMAVGPDNEVVAIGYTAQIGLLDTAATLSVDPVSNVNWVNGTMIGFGSISCSVSFTDGVPTFSNIVDTVGGRAVDDVLGTVLGSAIGGVDGVDDMIVKVATLTANDTDDRMLVVKYDTTGAIQWQKAILFDEGYDCKGADADIDADGNIYVCGSYEYTGNFPWPASAMNIVKFNSSGVKQWSRRVSGECEDFAASIVVGPDNNLYLSGVTSSNDVEKYIMVAAKYSTSGTVIWQRLLENTTTWTFTGGWFIDQGGGSNLAVRDGYVALGGSFGNLANTEWPTATVIQMEDDGTIFATGDWQISAASFSGTLSSDASDITVIDAGKTDSNIASGIGVNATPFDSETTNFLIPTLYGVNGADSQLTNGAYTLNLETTGTLTLPAGGTIKEGVVTSNPTIQLTPANPDVSSQKLVIKGGGAYNYTDNGININYNTNTAQVSDTLTFYVYSETYSNQTLYWWISPSGAGIGDTESGTVVLSGPSGDFSILVDSDDYEFTVRVSPENNNYDPDSMGVETGLINPDAPTFDSEHHLHLTTGNLAETSIFLGTDDQNVRTTVNGGIQITTPNTTDNVWTFDSTGSTTLPGALVNSTVAKTGVDLTSNNVKFEVTQVDGLTGAVTEIIVINSPNPVWVSNTSGDTLGDVNFTVNFDGSGNASVVVNSGGTGHTVGQAFYLNPESVGATLPTPTALDLTKSINKLTDGSYTLADGVEGQVMTLVLQTGTTDVLNLSVNVSNARSPYTTGTNWWVIPFAKYDPVAEANVPGDGVCTLIFTDGAWQASTGIWAD